MGSALLAGLGLAAPAGLNAFIPLLAVALAARFSDLIELERPFGFLASLAGIAVISLLLAVEIVVDKIPGLDHANDLIQSAVRPAAGAVLMMAATANVEGFNPVIALVLGLLVAGAVHAVKATSRPAITVATGGVGNPLVSLVEDAAAVLATVVALVAPLVVLPVLVLLGALLAWVYRKLRRHERRSPLQRAETLRR